MPNRSSKRQETGPSRRGFVAMLKATGQIPHEEPPEKNPAAVALGRLGGLKGGKARAAKLSPLKRKQIASRAAKTRWQNTKTKGTG